MTLPRWAFLTVLIASIGLLGWSLYRVQAREDETEEAVLGAGCTLLKLVTDKFECPE